MKNNSKILVGFFGQWLSVASAAGGIAIELVLHADIGYICISAAGFILAIATKIKTEGIKK